MRTSDAAFQHFALLSEANHLLGDLFDAVNSLSLVSWNVHPKVCWAGRAPLIDFAELLYLAKVFECASKLFQTGRAFEALAIPPSNACFDESGSG